MKEIVFPVVKTDGGGSIDGAEVNGVAQPVEDKIIKITVDKETVDLGNVDNTSDADKPISTATQTALDSISEDVETVSGNVETLSEGLATAEQDIQELQNDVDGLETGKVNVTDIINNVTSSETAKPLSANMGKELQNQITYLKQRGRYLSVWNATTGLAKTVPVSPLPYEYKSGDFFIVGVVGTTNYKPTGTQYTGTPSAVVETDPVNVNDTYYYDGSNWTLLSSGGVPEIAWGTIVGDIEDQTDLTEAIEQAITSKGYQTSQQVETAITAKGYQTSQQVEQAITAKGYQTSQQVENAIDARVSQHQITSVVIGTDTIDITIS